MPGQRRLDRARHHRQATGRDGLVGPAVHRQQPRIIQCSNVIGVEPARFGERVRLGGVAIPLGKGGPADDDATRTGVGRVVDPHPHLVQWHAVVDAPAGGLGRSIGAHHGDAGLASAVDDRWGCRAAADQHRIQFSQCCGRRRVAQRFCQLVGHQCGVAAPGAELGHRRGKVAHLEALAEVQFHRHRPGQHAADQHLHSGNVVGRQCQQPGTWPAQPVVGR